MCHNLLQQTDYDLVLDEEIEFVLAKSVAGNQNEQVCTNMVIVLGNTTCNYNYVVSYKMCFIIVLYDGTFCYIIIYIQFAFSSSCFWLFTHKC